ncbi:MAG: hypothetical protein ABI606_23905 [Rhodoferax sp.]
MQRAVAEQPINAFDVVLDGNRAGQTTPQIAQCQAAAQYHGLDGRQQTRQTFYVNFWEACGNNAV